MRVAGQLRDAFTQLGAGRRVDLREEGHSLFPGLACALGVTGGLMVFVEAHERVRFLGAVAQIPIKIQCAPVAPGRLLMLAELVMGVVGAVEARRGGGPSPRRSWTSSASVQ